MLDLDVVQMSADGLTVFYKDHPMDFLDSIKAPHRGWPYHRQVLRNESGTREWVSQFPGDVYHLTLAGRKLLRAHLPDADRNGRAMVRFYDFGPGDRVRVPTHVYFRRIQGQTFRVQADVGFTLGLRARKVELSEDGKVWTEVATASAGEIKEFRVDRARLGDGRLMLRVVR